MFNSKSRLKDSVGSFMNELSTSLSFDVFQIWQIEIPTFLIWTEVESLRVFIIIIIMTQVIDLSFI